MAYRSTTWNAMVELKMAGNSHRGNTLLWAILLPLLLAACGGGGGGADPVCEAPRIQLFGDSTLRTAAPYWVERFGSRIENRARDRTSTTELLTGTDGLNKPWPQSVNAPYYVVNFGLNDGWRRPGNDWATVAQYRANLERLASAPGARAIFQTPNPSLLENRGMAPYARAMREVAAERGIPVIDVFACFKDQPNWEQRLPDGTHPDEQGLRYIVDNCVAPVVEALPCAD